MIRHDSAPGNPPGAPAPSRPDHAPPGGSTPFRPDVIAAFRTPTDVPELTELLRLVVDVCTPLLSCPDGPDQLEVTFRDGRMAHVVVLPKPDPGEALVLSREEARLIRARRALHARLDAAAGEGADHA